MQSCHTANYLDMPLLQHEVFIFEFCPKLKIQIESKLFVELLEQLFFAEIRSRVSQLKTSDGHRSRHLPFENALKMLSTLDRPMGKNRG